MSGSYKHAKAGEVVAFKKIPIPYTFWPEAYVKHNRLVTSNPWACMATHLKMNVKDSKVRSQSLAFIEQSEDFSNSANTARIGSKPLLYYYSFLNLAKAYLAVRKNTCLSKCGHGLIDYDKGLKGRLTITSLKVKTEDHTPKRMSVYRETVEALGFNVPHMGPTSQFTELFGQTVSIQQLLTHTLNAPLRFFPVHDISFRFDPSEKIVWATMQIKRDDLAFNKNAPKEIRNGMGAFSEVKPGDSSPVRQYQSDCIHYRKSPIDALPALVEKTKKDIWSLLRPGKYNYFVSSISKTKRLSQVASCYQAMFYLGSIVRYRPDDFSRLLEGKHGWVIQEFVNTQPLQFVYLLGSALINAEMVFPESAL